MQRERTRDSLQTNLISTNELPSVVIEDRITKFFGLPKPIHGEYIDQEQETWPSNILLCATVFLEDAVNYRSIAHKVTRSYLLIYRWFSSPMIKKLHRFILIMNLSLALFEWPSSFSVTSDVRDEPKRIVFPFLLLMTIEGLTLIWFFVYISMKIACLGVKHIGKRFWIIFFLIVIIYSLCEWFVMIAFLSHVYQGYRVRRILRPVFMIEASQLMKKAIKAVHRDLLTIIACISLALIHILFFAVMAMFLFPKSDIRPDSQNSTYFSNLHDSVFQLLVLYSTANNPDVMMPAYSDRRLNALFFIIFVIIGIYGVQNIITAVVYRAFRGYFQNSIINSQLRRRIAVRASFEVLRKCVTHQGFIETKDTIPISVIQTVLNFVSMNQWHFDRINQRLNELLRENEAITLDQYFKLMQLLDLNPKLAPEINIRVLNETLVDRLKAAGRSKHFDLIGTVFAIFSVLLVTVEVNNRHLTNYKDIITYALPIAFINFSLLIYFVLEIMIKAWAYGSVNFFRSSITHILEAIVAFTCLTLQIIFMAIHGTPVISLIYVDVKLTKRPLFSLWEAIRTCNMLFIYRLVRFLPASKNIRIIVGTVFDQIRNGSAFFGILFSCYYTYSILGMELFGGAIENLYKQYNQSNQTVCGSYEQLGYWPNGFDDFYSSTVTLYHIMVVNQWFVFVNGFRDATNSKWSELYFILWYLFVTHIGLNICLALSGDIHDAKKKRADQREELIVSNMYDIYGSDLKEPSSDEITQRLNKHPYINFREYSSEIVIST